MAARKREGESLAPPSVRYAQLGKLNVYPVYEHELDALARGSSSSLFLNFALSLLPISLTLFVTLLTTTIPSDRLFLGFLTIAVLTAIVGLILLLLWRRDHRRSGVLLTAIKDRMAPSPGLLETITDQGSSREAIPPQGG